MLAVIKTGGKQYRVQAGDVLEVEKIEGEEGHKVAFDQVLLIDDDKNTLIGTPVLENARVMAEVLKNFKDEKVIVFKKKRRKQYRRKHGHRQELTRVRIEEIIPDLKTVPRKVEEKPEAVKKPEKAVPEKVVKPETAKEAKPKPVKEAKPEKKETAQPAKREAKPKTERAVKAKKTETKAPAKPKAGVKRASSAKKPRKVKE